MQHIDKESLKEEGWLYFLSPDKLYIVRLNSVLPGTWRKEMYKLKPKPAVAHPLRVVHDEPGYKLPGAYDHWTKLSPKTARDALLREVK